MTCTLKGNWRAALPGLFLVACTSAPAKSDARSPDPGSTAVEVTRPAADGWEAVVALDTGGVGVWTVKSTDLADEWGGEEVVAVDDEGVCWLLVPYSGRWTALPSVSDGKWLGALAIGDLDPDQPGREIVTGGERGNLYLVQPHPQGGTGVRLLRWFPGEEVHTVIAADFDPGRRGDELLVFTAPGRVYLGDLDGFVDLGPTTGRVRDALVDSADGGATPLVISVSRSGELERCRYTRAGIEREHVLKFETGLGRIARDARSGRVYAGTDDGRVLRVETGADVAEVIHRGALGVRGIAAGDFDGSGREQVALCGYDGRVHLLRAEADGSWSDQVLYDDEAKLHWLWAAELDGRNSGPELLCSGYGGRVVLLRRVP